MWLTAYTALAVHERTGRNHRSMKWNKKPNQLCSTQPLNCPVEKNDFLKNMDSPLQREELEISFLPMHDTIK
jgi:hypothetical protein